MGWFRSSFAGWCGFVGALVLHVSLVAAVMSWTHSALTPEEAAVIEVTLVPERRPEPVPPPRMPDQPDPEPSETPEPPARTKPDPVPLPPSDPPLQLEDDPVSRPPVPSPAIVPEEVVPAEVDAAPKPDSDTEVPSILAQPDIGRIAPTVPSGPGLPVRPFEWQSVPSGARGAIALTECLKLTRDTPEICEDTPAGRALRAEIYAEVRAMDPRSIDEVWVAAEHRNRSEAVLHLIDTWIQHNLSRDPLPTPSQDGVAGHRQDGTFFVGPRPGSDCHLSSHC